MPKIYEYFGIVFLIYTNDHYPVHVHAQYAEYESKIELIYEGGKLKEIVFKKVRGKKQLPKTRQKEIREFVNIFHKGIVKKWNDVMVFNKKPKFEKITKKI